MRYVYLSIFLSNTSMYMMYMLSKHFLTFLFLVKRKRRRSDSHLRQKHLYRRKIRKPMDNTKTPPKTAITQRLRTDLGRSVGVTTVIQLVWLNRFTGTQPTH